MIIRPPCCNCSDPTYAVRSRLHAGA
jgi:hypothetical protein